MGGRSGSPLTPKNGRFVKEYLVDLNGTQAAIRAGYSPKTANEQAARLLANVSVRKVIDEGEERKAKVFIYRKFKNSFLVRSGPIGQAR